MIAHAPFLYTAELESAATLCFRAFDGSNYEVRCAVSRLLGTLVAQTQLPPPPHLAKDSKGTHTAHLAKDSKGTHTACALRVYPEI